MIEPAQEFLRRNRVMEWLEGLGIARRQTRKLMEQDVIKGEPLPGKKQNGRDYYRKSQIKKDLGL